MTKQLEKAINQVSNLPDDLQDEVAEKISEYISNVEWEKLLDHPKSEILLKKMKAETIKEIEAGEILDADEVFQSNGIEDNKKI